MSRPFLLAFVCCSLAQAADPVRTAWIMSPAANARLARSLPDVQSVVAGDRDVIVRSAGLSLRYFGPLQAASIPSEGVREFEFRIPIQPQPETGRHARVPLDVMGTFVNGLPIYNHFESLSWNGAHLWHYDTVAYNDDGTVTAAGHPRAELTHPAPAGLLEELIRDGSRHSPLIGFGLDGYPVYGPWACARLDGTGGLRRMRSSYQLRSIVHREVWPDGTRLMPEQYGPDVNTMDPLGTFAEDYEYVAGSGDLDEFNGRFAITPEYPRGTYAYFMTTDATGKLAFPYLIGPKFYGRVPQSAAQAWYALSSKRIELSASEPRIEAGRPVRFQLEARDANGDPIRNFEYVHERPIHFLVASADLAEFDHIHPELAAGDVYEVAHTFVHGGKYRIWADYSLPGEAPLVDEFDVTVEGVRRPLQTLQVSSSLKQTVGALTVELAPARPLSAGDDIPITLNLSGNIDRLEPYLGAWAHVIIVGENFGSFAHAHPMEPAASIAAVHSHAVWGPPPNQIHIVTNFPSEGRYKVWVQLQQAGSVTTVPFVLQVGLAVTAKHALAESVPAGAIRIRVTQHGYEPARIEIPAGAPLTLAFTRESAPNCGSEVVFPGLSLRKRLPLGETVVVQLPSQAAGEMSFSCGMGMYRGVIVAR